MSAVIDTNVLVYRYDGRYPAKQASASELLRTGLETQDIFVPHQTIVEFVVATTRKRANGFQILDLTDATREAEECLLIFEILYPGAQIVRTALRGMMTYQLSWFDAHMWAYAECNGCDTMYSEDFQHDRVYGGVRIVNPFG